ncbi:hypothetical protein Bca52824_017981 [Brassica carinata]|uniref:Uncharacterized protein n=1 Tax=Brassica carinata TaxID=52824 RepID=A0A8X8AVY8_BRACI|nr:hypothetical protein Bca52824_017981 [Brassica carinata]
MSMSSSLAMKALPPSFLLCNDSAASLLSIQNHIKAQSATMKLLPRHKFIVVAVGNRRHFSLHATEESSSNNVEKPSPFDPFFFFLFASQIITAADEEGTTVVIEGMLPIAAASNEEEWEETRTHREHNAESSFDVRESHSVNRVCSSFSILN